jgi:spore coat polysaccharide biosynthesis protein SpsF
MKVVVVTQARTGSSRLPNKVLLQIQEKTLLQIHIDRIKESKQVDSIYIATTDMKDDDKIVELSNQLKVNCYRGSESDVLDRFYQTVKDVKPDLVVRLTSDCPLIDPELLDEVIIEALKKDVDYYTNIMEEKYPDGQDIEVFKFSALEKAWRDATLKSDREHVTPYIRNNSSYKKGTIFTSENHYLKENYNHVRLTVDELEDFEVIKKIIEDLGFNKDWKTYTDYYLNNPKIRAFNNKFIRNEGYQKSIEQEKNN